MPTLRVQHFRQTSMILLRNILFLVLANFCLADKNSEKLLNLAGFTSRSEKKLELHGFGTGFAISPDGYLVTASHVTKGADLVRVVFKNGKTLDARVIKEEHGLDLAVLKVDLETLNYLGVTSRTSGLGDDVYTIGYPSPLLLGTSQKFTKGSISSITGLRNSSFHYQVSVPIQPGNSGGALVSEESGEVTGIIVSTLKGKDVVGFNPQNVNYALKSSFIKPILEALEIDLTTPAVAAQTKSDRRKKVIEATCMVVTCKFSTIKSQTSLKPLPSPAGMSTAEMINFLRNRNHPAANIRITRPNFFQESSRFDPAPYLRRVIRDLLLEENLQIKAARNREIHKEIRAKSKLAVKPVTISDLSIEMLWVRPGTFEMGSSSGDSDETPHTVTFTSGFYLGKHEVTQAQWKKVMGSNPSDFKGVDRPVENVSWNDATTFCEKLTELERKARRLPAGMAYQLPTEAQWEYACRAGTKTTYAFGGILTTEQANIDGGPKESTDVGKYPANAWGFHDMHGNVWEWCADWSVDYPSDPASDPVGPADGSARVLRGGSWGSTVLYARSANRYRFEPAFSYSSMGFRLCLRPPSK